MNQSITNHYKNLQNKQVKLQKPETGQKLYHLLMLMKDCKYIAYKQRRKLHKNKLKVRDEHKIFKCKISPGRSQGTYESKIQTGTGETVCQDLERENR